MSKMSLNNYLMKCRKRTQILSDNFGKVRQLIPVNNNLVKYDLLA